MFAERMNLVLRTVFLFAEHMNLVLRTVFMFAVRMNLALRTVFMFAERMNLGWRTVNTIAPYAHSSRRHVIECANKRFSTKESFRGRVRLFVTNAARPH